MVNISEVTLNQEIRAIHALSELKVKIHISESDAYKFSLLNFYFNMDYSVGFNNGIDISRILEIDHSSPSTTIFSINKPLIFPKTMTEHLKNSWPKKRRYKFSFAGLITPERERTIENWLNKNYGKIYRLKDVSISHKIERKLYLKFNIQKPFIRKFGDLSF